MVKKLVISSRHNTAIIIHKNKVQEFIVVHNSYQVSDIYLGVINKIFQSINAAFVNLDINNKSGFIHVNDSGPLKRKQSITDVTKIFTINQKILVQIIKESTLHKGPKLTANITLCGRHIILMPFNHTICIARSISNLKQRNTLKALAILFKPLKMGLLFRQDSAGINEDILLKELNVLRKQWNFIEKSVITGNSPYLIYRNNSIVQKILQNFYNFSIKNIIIDSQQGFSQLRKYFHSEFHSLQQRNIKLQLLKPQEFYTVNSTTFSKIISGLGNHISLPLGSYISIEVSEALTTIDVNSGSFTNIPNPRATILMTNCLAANEIGYQLRKRNITGVIIIDFINMHKKKDQLLLLKHFSNVLENDHAKPRIVQLSELGLIEIIRQRKGKHVIELLNENWLHNNRYYYYTNTYANNLQSINLYNRSLTTANKLFEHMLIITQSYSHSIFFKRIFTSFQYIICKKQNINTSLNTTNNFVLLKIFTLYLFKHSMNITTTFLYTNLINNAIITQNI